MIGVSAVFAQFPRMASPLIAFSGGMTDVLVKDRIRRKFAAVVLFAQIENRFRFRAVGRFGSETGRFVVGGNHVVGDFAVGRKTDQPLDIAAVAGSDFCLSCITDDFAVHFRGVEFHIRAGFAFNGEFRFHKIVVEWRQNGLQTVEHFLFFGGIDRSRRCFGDERKSGSGNRADYTKEKAEINNIDLFGRAHLTPPWEWTQPNGRL